MKTTLERNGWFVLVLAVVALSAGYAAYHFRDLSLAMGGGVVALFVLHLLGLRSARKRCVELRALERLLGELEGTPPDETLAARRFSLGAAALVEGLMDVDQVFRTLVAERRKPDVTFRDHALGKEYLTEEEFRTLVEAKKEGRYIADQIEGARREVEALWRETDPEAG